MPSVRKSRKKDPSKEAERYRREALSEALNQIHGLEAEVGVVLRQMQEKVRQLECITEFSALMNSTLDTQVVREKALEATCQLLQCETASLFLIDSKTGELVWETALGASGKELQKTVRLKVDNRSIAGYVAMTGESLLINDVEKDPRHSLRVKEKTSFKTKTMVCVPLRSKSHVLGVLQAINKIPTLPPRPSRHSWPDFHEDDLKLLQTLGHQAAIAVENSQLYASLKRSFYGTVEALAEAIEKKDRYTGGHTKRVVYYTECLAKFLGLTSDEQEQFRLAAILHDVGKIGIEDKILKKPAPLDPYEWPVMKTHPELGYQIMSRVEGMQEVIDGMRFHHERWDGKGYPLGLKGEEIPLVARVISVADTYDAMISNRPYRKGLDPKAAFDEIVTHRETQFCPRVVDAFVQAFKAGKMGRGSG